MIHQVWVGLGEEDRNEGSGGTRVVGYFRTEEAAREAVRHEGVWGRPGEVRLVNGFIIDCSGMEYFCPLSAAMPLDLTENE